MVSSILFTKYQPLQHGCRYSVAAEWPSDLVGLWKGAEVARVSAVGEFDEGARGGDGDDRGDVTRAPSYTQMIEGYAPNPWLFLDPRDHSKIVSSNIGWGYFSEAPEMFAKKEQKKKNEDGTSAAAGVGDRVFFNRVFKYTAGGNHPGGREQWCNNYVARADGKQLIMLSNSEPGDGDANAPPPVCPAAPCPKLQLDVLGADALTANGAVSADVMMKL